MENKFNINKHKTLNSIEVLLDPNFILCSSTLKCRYIIGNKYGFVLKFKNEK